MNSFLLVSKDLSQQQEYLKKFITERAISSFDVTKITQEGSIGIESIRKLAETLFLAPVRGKEKIVVVENAERLTIEAQNSLLKILEEPPSFVSIFLSATTEEVFLPTILSRCKVIELSKNESITLSENEKEELAKDIIVLQNGSLGEKLALAENASSNKEHLSRWFLGILTLLREIMLKDLPSEKTLYYSQLLTALQDAYKTFSTTNVSPRIILEHALLKLMTSDK